MRAAASSEGLRIWRSWQTAVRKRTASAMTPVSPSAKAYRERQQADLWALLHLRHEDFLFENLSSQASTPCMSVILEAKDSLTGPMQYDGAPSICKQTSLHLCTHRSGSSKPVRGKVGGKPVGPHCQHRSPSHRCDGRRQLAAASPYR